MPAFDYVALDAQGKRQRGILEADSDRLARQQLREKQLIPVEVSESRKKQNSAKGEGFSLFQGIAVKDLSLFTRHLATLAQSGIPLEEALHATAELRRGDLPGVGRTDRGDLIGVGDARLEESLKHPLLRSGR